VSARVASIPSRFGVKQAEPTRVREDGRLRPPAAGRRRRAKRAALELVEKVLAARSRQIALKAAAWRVATRSSDRRASWDGIAVFSRGSRDARQAKC
jgi:hypothetical protein